jgi:hypothetical protein
LTKLIRPFGRRGLDRSDGACSHECQGCPERGFDVWRSQWHQAVPSRPHLSWGEARSSRASNLGIQLQLAAFLWRALKLALSNKTALEFWAVGAHFRRRHWPWVLWRSPMMLKREDTIAQQETHSGDFWLPCCSQRGSRAIVTSPTVPTMATMMITVHPAHSWPRFMGG